MAKAPVKICSEKCQFFKKYYKPYYGSECLFDNNGYYKQTKYGKYCKNFERRITMYVMRSKSEITRKYIDLLKKEGKGLEDYAQIELLEWIFKMTKEGENNVKK